jgi:exopolyphosphatase/pppGpp-phosphohydrolase
VESFAEAHDPDPGHARQVAFLALRLFDELAPLHRLGERERRWLEYAALLHDVGWSAGGKGHHKYSFLLIMENSNLPFDPETRRVVAAVARYHRKALPAMRHRHFAALTPEERAHVRTLAALLRIADGLDAGHTSAVTDVRCRSEGKKVIIACSVVRAAEPERAAAVKKGDLFREVFAQEIIIEWRIMQ